MLIALRLVGILAASLVLLPGTRAQDAVIYPTVTEHQFGSIDGRGPGFKVWFDTVGAGIRRIALLDHEAHRVARDSERGPYEIVLPEKVDPSDKSRGEYTWLLLEAIDKEPFAALEKGLDLATWTEGRKDADSVSFTLDLKNGLVVERLYAWDAGRRDLRLEFALRAAADSKLTAGEPVRVRLGGIGLASPRAEWILGANPSLAVGVSRSETAGATETFAAADGERGAGGVNLALKPADGNIEYAGSANRFFAALLYPLDDDARRAFKRADLREVPDLPQLDTPPYSIPVADATLELLVPAAGAESRARFRFYLGPKSYRVFDENAEYARFDPVMKHTLDPMCFCTIPGARAIATFLLWLLAILHSGVGNWGVAIMILTVLVRGALTPLNFKMQKSMRAYGQKMGKLKPKLDAIQRDFKNDPKRLQQEMVAFQREHKLFPPLGGCLPMFATIPIFLGLFTALRVAYELRLQPFVFWIDDLSRPDQLFEVGLSWLPYFNLLPLLMIGLWLWLQASAPLPTDPQQRQMMKIMRLMPFVFGVTLYNYASGLMVYMITSSIFGLAEQRVTRRILGPIDPNAAVMGGTPMI